MTLKLTKQKCNKILKNLDLTLKHANNMTIREFSKIVGMLEAAILGVKYGRLHLFHSVKCKNQDLTMSQGSYDCYFNLSSESIVEINWWKAKIPKSYKTIHKELLKKTIYSDVCPNGWEQLMKTCHQEVTGRLKIVNCILICCNYLLLIMHYKFTAKICLILQSI